MEVATHMAHAQNIAFPMRWLVLAVPAVLSLVLASSAQAAGPPPVPLGTADSFAVMAGSTITNTGPTLITGNLGLHPGTAVTGFPPGTVIGAEHAGNAAAQHAATDLTTAFNDAANGRPPRRRRPTSAGGRSPAASTRAASSARSA